MTLAPVTADVIAEPTTAVGLPPSCTDSTAVGPPANRTASRDSGAVWNAVAVTIVWLSATAVLAIWVAGGGLQALSAGGGDAFTSIGRLTGLLGANLMLLQVLFMARIPAFEQGFGHDGLVRWHRLLGFATFWLLTAHVAFIVLGYSITAGVGPGRQLREFVLDYPGMLLATAGTVAVCLPVVALSVRRVRRRMRYEAWHLWHLYAYLGIALAIPHMLWNGNDFLSSWLATIYWIAIWSLAFLAVVSFRLAVPWVRSRRTQLRVVAVRPDGSRGLWVRMRGKQVARLGTRAGQFFVWRFRDGPGWTRAHPFSIANAPGGDELDLAVRVVGDGTTRMASLPLGTPVCFEGPFGRLTGARRATGNLLMIGAGAGVAPLVSLLAGEPWAPGAATLLTRDNTPAEAMLRPQIAALVSDRGLRWEGVFGQPDSDRPSWGPSDWSDGQGQQVLRSIVGDGRAVDVFLCGPEPWMRALRADLAAVGVPNSRVHSESFAM